MRLLGIWGKTGVSEHRENWVFILTNLEDQALIGRSLQIAFELD